MDGQRGQRNRRDARRRRRGGSIYGQTVSKRDNFSQTGFRTRCGQDTPCGTTHSDLSVRGRHGLRRSDQPRVVRSKSPRAQGEYRSQFSDRVASDESRYRAEVRRVGIVRNERGGDAQKAQRRRLCDAAQSFFRSYGRGGRDNRQFRFSETKCYASDRVLASQNIRRAV